MKNLSIVIPVFNSEVSIYNLVKEINDIFVAENIEIILVNDDSKDKSHEECLRAYKDYNNRVLYLKLTKNVGEHNAVMAGLNYSSGEWLIIMDDDFQNPPSESLKLFNFSKHSNYDVVYCNYNKKKHSYFRNFISKVNDLTANIILNKPKNIYLSSFKCIKKKIYKQIIKYKGPSPYIDGLILQTTLNLGNIESEHEVRKNGQSNYTLIKLVKLYSNLFINFSTVPIHFFSISGLIISITGVLYAMLIIIEKIINPNLPAGYSSLIAIVVFFSGIQLIFLGLLGEYIGKILKKVNEENQYFVDFEKSKIDKKE